MESSRAKTQSEIADLIERFLQNRSLYPQEWNDSVDCTQQDPAMDEYRRKCYELDPLVNRPQPVDEAAILELRELVERLREP
jgi:hypothetical protein